MAATLACVSLQAQTRNFYSTADGLSSSLINRLYQDDRGFIWVATEYGLNRFDGLNFTNYQHVSNDTTTLTSNYVRTIFEDSRHNLLVGCNNGLMRYDRETDSFHEIPMLHDGVRVTPHVTHMQEMRDGGIWLSTSGHGMFRMDTLLTRALSVENRLQQMNLTYQSKFCIDSHEEIWIGTEGNGLVHYIPGTKELQRFDYPESGSYNVTAIVEDPLGNILVGTQKQGILRYDPERRQMVPVPYHGQDGKLSIYCMAIVDGQVLTGTDGQGLKIYNPLTDRLEDYNIETSPVDLSNGKVHDIFEDRDGNLWLALFQKGIVFIPKQENPFEYYGSGSIGPGSLDEGCVLSLFQDSKRHLWVGVDNRGLYELGADGKRLRHFAPGNNGDGVPNIIMSIFEDSEHNFWLGSYGQGVGKFNKNTGSFEPLQRLNAPIVYSVAEDGNKNLYFAMFGLGFYQYNLRTQGLVHYESTKDEKNDLERDELANDWINYIFCDSEDMVWLGHYKGVSCFNPKTKSFLSYNHTNTLIADCIGYAFAEDRNGHIWCGTTSGLYRFDKKSGEMKRFTTAEGLPNNVICGICEDGAGNIWVSTYKGLGKYDVRREAFVNYYAGDGLQGNEFTHGAYFKGAGGKLFFGGVSGITGFYPEKITDDAKELKVYITDFQVFNQPVRKQTLSGGKPIISTSVQDAERFRLAYNDNTFTIVFSTLQYNNPEEIVYEYRIDELGRQWSVTEPQVNHVTYNNLRPGNYTFRVRAVNHGNYSDARTIKILIASPWYKRWWAYCLYVCLAAILAWSVVNGWRSRMRYRRELVKREHDEQLNEAKLQFFTNISHEIRTPMTLIVNPLEKLLAEEKQGPLQRTYLMIYRNAQRILRLINQLMDIQKLDKGQMKMAFRETDMVGFITDVMLPFEYTAHERNIAFTFIHEMPELKAWIDLNNFDKVLMNVLSNAFKFTADGGNITVSLTVGQAGADREVPGDYYEIALTDSGIGIEKDQLERIFDRFYQVNNEVTKSSLGTGVGLHLSRSLVKLHHGTIHAENRQDAAGSRFVIRMPLGSGHVGYGEIASATVPYKPKTITPALEAEADGEAAAPHKAKTRLKVLIVEDEQEIRDYMMEELSDEYRVACCGNGKEAYERILKEPPDLVVSDIMMPDMDGLTLCHLLKQNTNVNHIPVVLLTAKSGTQDMIEGIDSGADAYIVKPFNTEFLKSTVANLLSNRRLLRNKFSGAQEQQDKVEKLSLKSGDEMLMDRIMKVVNKHLGDPDLNVEMLASEVGLSRVHVHRKLKELTNLSTRDFIKNIRLQQAAALLTQDKKMSISEVAYAVGYVNLSHFSTSFKEKYGISPKEYMNKETAAREG